jgi:hypothetical protein
MNTDIVNAVLVGAVAMAAFVAATFFLRFWRQTGDSFFLLFSLGFWFDGATRLVLALDNVSDETEPLYYSARLITFSLIIAAIVLKNRSVRRD